MSAARRARLAAGPGIAAALLLVLAGCSAGDAGSPEAEAPGSAEKTEIAGPAEPAPGVPEECVEAYPWATGPADIGSLELVPEGWPEPPAGSTLCTVTSGGEAETASYVSQTPAAEVLEHYEKALEEHAPARVSGDENGTGYDSLDGSDGESLGFQIRESEGGFLIAFINGDAVAE